MRPERDRGSRVLAVRGRKSGKTQTVPVNLLTHEGRCRGALVWDRRRGPALVWAGAVVLATGGIGKSFKVTVSRGEMIPTDLAPHAMATVHPSSLLRAPDDETRRAEIAKFVADLKVAAGTVRSTIFMSSQGDQCSA